MVEDFLPWMQQDQPFGRQVTRATGAGGKMFVPLVIGLYTGTTTVSKSGSYRRPG